MSEMEQPHLEEAPASKPSGLDTNRKIQLGLVAALVVVAVAMYAWKAAAVGEVEARLAELEASQAQARSQLLEQARQLDARRSEEALGRFSLPLAWAIRREVMAANLDQVDQYFSDLVQLPGFQSAVLAKPDGKLAVASDRSKLAGPFSSLYPEQYLQATEIRVEPGSGGSLRAVIPIMGLNQHLGTMVVEYAPPAFGLQ